MARREIAPGQRYQPTDSTVAWEVFALSKDPEGIVHARLKRVGNGAETKTISVSALRDPRLYKALPVPAEATA